MFVRNIGWDVTERQFKEHMEQFGPLHYAVLCKAARDMKVEQIETQETHKGTGFVRFKKAEDAKSLVELSRKLEEQLDLEHKSKDKKKKGKKEDTVIGQTSLLKGELELNGRLLKIMPQVARTSVDSVLQQNKDKEKNKGEDRRNLYLKKEGLLAEKEWVHQQPALTAKDLEQRQALYIAKDKALKNSPNLSVSKVRMQIRNLPKRDFNEPELKQLMLTVCDAFRQKNPGCKQSSKQLIIQVKILRDAEKTVAVNEENPNDLTAANLGKSFKQSSGLAFVELSNEDAALYAVRHLNNLQLTPNKGLIVDFCLQDARKLYHRQLKLDKHRKIAEEKKLKLKKEKRLQ